MNWTDVTRPPSERVLRQFGALVAACAVLGGGLRWYHGRLGPWAAAIVVAAIVAGILGIFWPRAIRPVYTASMVAAFPIGWTVSRVVLGLLFYVVVTPIGWALKAGGRDALGRKRRQSYWVARPPSGSSSDYFRQS